MCFICVRAVSRENLKSYIHLCNYGYWWTKTLRCLRWWGNTSKVSLTHASWTYFHLLRNCGQNWLLSHFIAMKPIMNNSVVSSLLILWIFLVYVFPLTLWKLSSLQLGSAERFMKESQFLIYGNGKDNPATGFMFEKQHMKGLYFNQSPNKVNSYTNQAKWSVTAPI